jgi:hypothetical protein
MNHAIHLFLDVDGTEPLFGASPELKRLKLNSLPSSPSSIQSRQLWLSVIFLNPLFRPSINGPALSGQPAVPVRHRPTVPTFPLSGLGSTWIAFPLSDFHFRPAPDSSPDLGRPDHQLLSSIAIGGDITATRIIILSNLPLLSIHAPNPMPELQTSSNCTVAQLEVNIVCHLTVNFPSHTDCPVYSSQVRDWRTEKRAFTLPRTW